MKGGTVFRYVFIVIGALLVLFYALLMLSGYSNEEGSSLTKDKYEDGYYFLYTLLDRLGYKVHRFENFYKEISDSVIIFHDQIMDSELFNKYEERIYSLSMENRFVFMGEFNLIHSNLGLEVVDTNSPLVSRDEALEQGRDLSSTLVLKDEALKKGIDSIQINLFQAFVIKASDLKVLAASGDGPVIVKNDKDYFIADSTLFDNLNMKDPSVALLVNNLFAPYYDKNIYFYEKARAMKFSKIPISIIFKGRLFFITMQLLLFTGLFLFQQSRRFGNPLRPDIYGRRTVLEHIRGEGFFYRKARGAHVVDQLDIRYFIYQLGKILGEGHNPSSKDVIEILTTRFNQDPELLKELLYSSRSFSDGELLKRRRQRNEILTNINE